MPGINSRDYYKHEQNRLRSYENWPDTAPIQSQKLAEAGLFYMGTGLEVKCYECNGQISEWTADVEPLRKHRELFPDCKFVKGESDNVPLSAQNTENTQNRDSPDNDSNGIVIDEVRSVASDESRNVNERNNTESFESRLAQRQNEIERDPQIAEFRRLMRSERNRLRTFFRQNGPQWPHDHITPEEIARAGFYYRGEVEGDDRVQCVFCLGVVYSFERGDRALHEHARHYPLCPFIMGDDVGNEPIVEDPVRGPQRHMPERGYDVCGNYVPADFHLRVRPPRQHLSASNNQHLSSNNSFNQPSDNHRNLLVSTLSLDAYGISPHRGPKHLDKRTLETRLATFTNPMWNKSLDPNKFAEAGFFYIGVQDYVKCFSCDNGLCNWKVEDDPWFKHAASFPRCEFIRIAKGEQFISTCLKQQEEMEKENEEKNMILKTSTVNIWMESPTVKRLINLDTFSQALIRASLNIRWEETQTPYETFEELYYACYNLKMGPSRHVDAKAIASHFLTTSTPSTSSNSTPSTSSASTNDEEPMNIDEITASAATTTSLSSQSSSQSSVGSSIDDEASSCSSMSSSPPSSPPVSSLSTKPFDPENRLLCKVCLDREVRFAFLPCGHLGCSQCTPALVDCPVCRKKILGNVRIFL